MASSDSYLDALPDGKTPPMRLLNLRWLKDFDELATYPQPLIEGVFEKVGIGVIYGPPNSGKSTLAVDMAVSVAGGMDWHGRKTRSGLVLIIAGEAPESTIRRIRAKCRDEGVDPQIPLLVHEGPVGLDTANVARIVETVTFEADRLNVAPALVIFDTLAANDPGPEDAEHFTRVARGMNIVSADLDCCVLAVHHSGKDILAGMRGHSSLNGAVDTAIELKSSSTDNYCAVVKKQRDGVVGEEFWFKLKAVTVGYREAPSSALGDEVTACVLEEVVGARSGSGRPLKGHKATALEALRSESTERGIETWTRPEAYACLKQFHKSKGGGTLGRNTPRETITSLVADGLLIEEGNYVKLRPDT
jgi:AAA domain